MARAAWLSTVKASRQELKRRDAILGMVACIQTFGELVNFICTSLVSTDGVFTPDGTFVYLTRVEKQLLLGVS